MVEEVGAASIGNIVRYRLTVKNPNENSSIHNFVVIDPLPSHLKLVAGSINVVPAINAHIITTDNTNEIRVVFTTLAADVMVYIYFDAEIVGSGAGGKIVNIARIHKFEPDLEGEPGDGETGREVNRDNEIVDIEEVTDDSQVKDKAGSETEVVSENPLLSIVNTAPSTDAIGSEVNRVDENVDDEVLDSNYFFQSEEEAPPNKVSREDEVIDRDYFFESEESEEEVPPNKVSREDEVVDRDYFFKSEESEEEAPLSQVTREEEIVDRDYFFQKEADPDQENSDDTIVNRDYFFQNEDSVAEEDDAAVAEDDAAVAEDDAAVAGDDAAVAGDETVVAEGASARSKLSQTGAIASLSALASTVLAASGLAQSKKKKRNVNLSPTFLDQKYDQEYDEIFGD